MADNNNETVVRITADTSGVDQPLDNASQRLSRFERLAQRAGSVISNMWHNMTQEIEDSTREIEEFSEDLSGIGTAFDDFDMKQIQDEIDRTTRSLDSMLSRSDKMQALGADRSSAAFRSLQYDIDQARNKLSELNFSLSGELEQAIASVNAEMQHIAGTDVPTQEYADLQSKVERLDTSFNRLIDKQEEMEALGTSHSSAAWQRLQYRIEQTAAQINQYQQQMQAMEASGTAFTSGVDSSAYAEAERLLTEYQEQLEQAQTDTVDYANSGGKSFSDMFSRAVRGAKSLGSSILKSLGKGIQNGFNNAGKSVSSFISKLKNLGKQSDAVSKLTKSLTRSLTSLVTMMTSRVKSLFIGSLFEDTQEQFGKIAEISPRFNAAVSSMIDSVEQLGAQLVAAVEPIVSVVGPAISSLIDKLSAGADTVSQFVARLTGDNSYIKATKGQSDYAASIAKTEKNTKGATKAAKDYKATVLSFDELHKLEGQDKDDGIGIDIADLDKAQTEATKLNKIADEIHDALEKDDFYGVGKVIAKGINEAFSWLDNVAGWSNNSEKFTKIFQNIVDSVNGFTDNINTAQIGSQIADVLNTIIHGFDILTDPETGIHFTEIGKRIGELFLGLVTNIDWDTLGRAFINSIQAGVKILNGALSSTIIDETTGEEISVGTAIGRALDEMFTNAIETINPDDWSDLISNIVNNTADLIIAFFGDQTKVAELAEKIAATINQAVEDIDADDLAAAISSLAQTIVTFVGKLFTEINWGEVWDKLVATLSSESFDWEAVLKATGILAIGGLIGNAFATSISGAIIGAVTFGVTSAIHGVKSLTTDIIPKGIEADKNIKKEREKFELSEYREADFSNVKTFGNNWKVGAARLLGGGDVGAAAMQASISGEAITDANENFVAFGTKIYDAQEYVDLFNDSVDGLNSAFIEVDGETKAVTEQMRDVADRLIEQGKATTDANSSLYDLQESLWDTDNNMTNLGAGLESTTWKFEELGIGIDNLNKKLDGFDYNIIKTNYGDGGSSIPSFAGGGIVGDGQIFIANEGGQAELIGGDGRGNTAIVNNDQIISAVVTGVKQAVMEAGYAIAESVSEAVGQDSGGDVVLNIDSVEIARASNKGNRKMDRRSNHVVFT